MCLISSFSYIITCNKRSKLKYHNSRCRKWRNTLNIISLIHNTYRCRTASQYIHPPCPLCRFHHQYHLTSSNTCLTPNLRSLHKDKLR
jgi:hypothetical protein